MISPYISDTADIPVVLGYIFYTRLEVVLGVPVRVEDDDRVGSGQVDAQPARTSGQQEGKIGGACKKEQQQQRELVCGVARLMPRPTSARVDSKNAKSVEPAEGIRKQQEGTAKWVKPAWEGEREPEAGRASTHPAR